MQILVTKTSTIVYGKNGSIFSVKQNLYGLLAHPILPTQLRKGWTHRSIRCYLYFFYVNAIKCMSVPSSQNLTVTIDKFICSAPRTVRSHGSISLLLYGNMFLHFLTAHLPGELCLAIYIINIFLYPQF